jgi:hypothetical protein
VGAVRVSRGAGNFFGGDPGGPAVFDRALRAEEHQGLGAEGEAGAR